jgi:hypothetical protein
LTLNTYGLNLADTETISFFSVSGEKLFEADFSVNDHITNIELPESITDQMIFVRPIDENNSAHISKVINRR